MVQELQGRIKEEPIEVVVFEKDVTMGEAMVFERDWTGSIEPEGPNSASLRDFEAANTSEALTQLESDMNAVSIGDEPVMEALRTMVLARESELKCQHISKREVSYGREGTLYTAELSGLQCTHFPRMVVFQHIVLKEDGANNEMVHAVTMMRDVRHPNLVPIYEIYLPNENNLWIMYPNLLGASVYWLATYYRISTEEIANICQAICLSLQYLHRDSIVHRGVISENIILTPEGNVKMFENMGCIKLPSPTGRCYTKFGAEPWMAPEMAAGKGYTTKADIWSLGITILELSMVSDPHFARREPRDGGEYILKYGINILDPQQASPELRHFLSRCLCVDENERASVSELLEHDFLKMACGVHYMRVVMVMKAICEGHKKNGSRSKAA